MRSGMRWCILAGFLVGGPVRALAEDITITTYYPSPRGIYQELRTTDNTYLAYLAGRVGIGMMNPATKLSIL